MKVKDILRRLRKDPKEAVHYIVGTTTLWMHERKSLRWLLPFHVRFWIEYRKIRAAECLENRECLCCGCDTPGVFGSTKGCKAYKYRGLGFCESDKKVCYPPLYSRQRTLIFLTRCIKKLNGGV